MTEIPRLLEDVEVQSGLVMLKISLRRMLKKFDTDYKIFTGSIIDVETDEQKFLDGYSGAKRYRNHSIVCCGVLDKDNVKIIAKTCNASDKSFAEVVTDKLGRSAHPYYAFNAGIEMALLSKLMGRETRFERELQFEIPSGYEKKEYVVRNLGIPNFDDPFYGEGIYAAKEWTKHLKIGDLNCIKLIMAHNLGCLLKEHSILIRRGYREIKSHSYKGFFKGQNELVYGKTMKTFTRAIEGKEI